MSERIWTVIVVDDTGAEAYRRQERGYSPLGVMTQICERASAGLADPPEPDAAVHDAEIAGIEGRPASNWPGPAWARKE